MSLVLARVDDRLVHGQVVLAWGQNMSVDRLLVADDEVAANPWERELMGTAAEDMQVDVVLLQDLPAYLVQEEARSGSTILLMRSLEAARLVVESGVTLSELNLGGLHFSPGKERFLDYLYLDEGDRSILRALLDRGVRIQAQDVPTSKPIDARELLSKEESE